MKLKENKKNSKVRASNIVLNNHFLTGRKTTVKKKKAGFLKNCIASLFTFLKSTCHL